MLFQFRSPEDESKKWSGLARLHMEQIKWSDERNLWPTDLPSQIDCIVCSRACLQTGIIVRCIEISVQ